MERCIYPGLVGGEEAVMEWEGVVDDFEAVLEGGVLPRVAGEFKELVVNGEWGKATKLYKDWR